MTSSIETTGDTSDTSLRDSRAGTADPRDLPEQASVSDREERPVGPRYERVLLKLSGEVFGGGGFGVDPDVVENERRIAEATAREEGKPEAALVKITEGRVNGFYKDVVLLEQSSVQDSKKTVKALLDEKGVTVRRFVRFEVGA